MVTLERCLDARELESLASEGVPPDQLEQMDQHLTRCGSCSQRHDALVRDLELLLRRTVPPRKHPEQPIIDRLTTRFKALRTTPSGSTDPQTWAPTLTPAPAETYPSVAPPCTPDRAQEQLGSYRLVRELGRGGMGAVYLAEDTVLHRQVALKVMRGELALNSEARERFLREARAAATLTHDNVVSIFHCGQEEGVSFLVMPFLEGEPLDRLLTRAGSLPSALAARIAREAAAGLAAAHQHGLIHRDIKPSNIWIETKEAPAGLPTAFRVKVLDFGLAVPVENRGELTRPGDILGTPAYMAPEQARAEAIDGRADLFSLGCVLYRMVTGRAPFGGATVSAQLLAVATETPPAAQTLNSDVPAALSHLIEQMLSKKAEQRPGSADEVVDRLAQIEQELARPQPQPVPAGRPPRKRRKVEILAGVAAVFVLLAMGIIISIESRKPDGSSWKVQVEFNNRPTQASTKDKPPQPKDGDKKAPVKPTAGPELPKIEQTLSGAHCACFSPDGKLILTAHSGTSPDGPLYGKGLERIYKANGEEIHREDFPAFIEVITCGPAREWFAHGGGTPYRPGQLHLRSLDLKQSVSLPGHQEMVRALQFSPDGRWLASGSADHKVRLWDVKTQKLIRQLDHHDGPIHALAFHPHKRVLASGGSDRVLCLTDLTTWKTTRVRGHPDGISSIVYRPDGQMLATGSNDGVRLWDSADGKLLGHLTHSDWQAAGCFTRNGKFVFSADVDQGRVATIRIWDVVKLAQVASFPAQARAVNSICLSPDGKRLLTGHHDRLAHVWSLPDWLLEEDGKVVPPPATTEWSPGRQP